MPASRGSASSAATCSPATCRPVSAAASCLGAGRTAAGSASAARLALDAIDIRIDDRPLTGFVDATSIDRNGAVRIRMVYRRTGGSGLTVRSNIPARLARGHRELVSVRGETGEVLVE